MDHDDFFRGDVQNPDQIIPGVVGHGNDFIGPAHGMFQDVAHISAVFDRDGMGKQEGHQIMDGYHDAKTRFAEGNQRGRSMKDVDFLLSLSEAEE